MVLYSNLGGVGPDTPTGASAGKEGIRYVNVGTYSLEDGELNYLDLVLTAIGGDYTPYDANLNGLNGQFAQINLACGTEVRLRVTFMSSCATAPSCKLCASGDSGCYAAGCSCFQNTVYNEADCQGVGLETSKDDYGCANMGASVVLPGNALITMTIYDLDKGLNGAQTEYLVVPGEVYYKTPLQAASGNVVDSAINVGLMDAEGFMVRTFTGTAQGSDIPTDRTQLTDTQASKGLDLYLRSTYGHADLTFGVFETISSEESDSECTGGSLLFSGNAVLCAPPPPAPPVPPPSPPP